MDFQLKYRGFRSYALRSCGGLYTVVLAPTFTVGAVGYLLPSLSQKAVGNGISPLFVFFTNNTGIPLSVELGIAALRISDEMQRLRLGFIEYAYAIRLLLGIQNGYLPTHYQ
ncbi:MAG: hypothetical protein EAY72_11010 [Bacteroidetes bacterium]|nr:MAG: hypothetical protein EAY72_11010 [Bacteroidota bacterium]